MSYGEKMMVAEGSAGYAYLACNLATGTGQLWGNSG
jgi:hypothetical protein